MPRPRLPQNTQELSTRKKTPTFLLELPLAVTPGQAQRVRAHLEAARQFYNAVLSKGRRRLRRMRADPAWQAVRAMPRSQPQERRQAFAALRQQYGFTEYALYEAAKALRVNWLADHLDAVLAQTLASRAYRALNRVCLGQARRVRFRSKGRGISSVENKRNDTGLRFLLQPPEEGNRGYLLWQGDELEALIDWHDPVVAHGLRQRVKYARLLQRPASSPRAQGADVKGFRYVVQLALEGIPYQKPRHRVGQEAVGLDLGPSTIAIVSRQGEARLDLLCAELAPDAQAIRRLQRQLERQRRANNPENFDAQGRIKKPGKGHLQWKHSRRYQATRRRKASKERKLAAHRKSLHGRLAHQIVAVGNTVITEKISYCGWQKTFGRSVNLRAPGMFISMLKRTVASTGGTLVEVSTRATRLSQFCHGCGEFVPKPLWQRWHSCPCGVGPVQRDVYSAFLAAYLDPADPSPSRARQRYTAVWEGREPGLRAACERLLQRASVGQPLPRSLGMPRVRARLLESPRLPLQEPVAVLAQGPREAKSAGKEPPGL